MFHIVPGRQVRISKSVYMEKKYARPSRFKASDPQSALMLFSRPTWLSIILPETTTFNTGKPIKITFATFYPYPYIHLAPVVQRVDKWISVGNTNYTIHWIVIYPVDGVIYPLNNRGLIRYDTIRYYLRLVFAQSSGHFVKLVFGN